MQVLWCSQASSDTGISCLYVAVFHSIVHANTDGSHAAHQELPAAYAAWAAVFVSNIAS